MVGCYIVHLKLKTLNTRQKWIIWKNSWFLNINVKTVSFKGSNVFKFYDIEIDLVYSFKKTVKLKRKKKWKEIWKLVTLPIRLQYDRLDKIC